MILPGWHSITKHTGGGLARRSESKTPKYLSKNSNISKMLKSYPQIFLKYSPKAQRLETWDKISFSLRIVPLIIHMNHFSYPLTIVQINIFEEPQNIFPNQNPRPQTIEPAPVFLTVECPPGMILTMNTTFFSHIHDTISVKQILSKPSTIC